MYPSTGDCTYRVAYDVSLETEMYLNDLNMFLMKGMSVTLVLRQWIIELIGSNKSPVRKELHPSTCLEDQGKPHKLLMTFCNPI